MKSTQLLPIMGIIKDKSGASVQETEICTSIPTVICMHVRFARQKGVMHYLMTWMPQLKIYKLSDVTILNPSVIEFYDPHQS